jgi:hypothetical protein
MHMSAKQMTLTVLATKLAAAVAEDEAPESGGCDLSAGLFGQKVSDWLRDLADQLTTDDKDDAENFRWLLEGNGFFMEGQDLCGYVPCSPAEKEQARTAIRAARLATTSRS